MTSFIKLIFVCLCVYMCVFKQIHVCVHVCQRTTLGTYYLNFEQARLASQKVPGTLFLYLPHWYTGITSICYHVQLFHMDSRDQLKTGLHLCTFIA